jgi:hypothetical protein
MPKSLLQYSRFYSGYTYVPGFSCCVSTTFFYRETTYSPMSIITSAINDPIDTVIIQVSTLPSSSLTAVSARKTAFSIQRPAGRFGVKPIFSIHGVPKQYPIIPIHKGSLPGLDQTTTAQPPIQSSALVPTPGEVAGTTASIILGSLFAICILAGLSYFF